MSKSPLLAEVVHVQCNVCHVYSEAVQSMPANFGAETGCLAVLRVTRRCLQAAAFLN